MEEKTIWKVSLLTVLLGLTILYFYTEKVELKSNIDLSEIPIDQEVKIRGEITSLRIHEKVIFLEITGERVETVDIVLFNDQDLFLEEGNYVEIEGRVEEYNGKKEIIADKIVLNR